MKRIKFVSICMAIIMIFSMQIVNVSAGAEIALNPDESCKQVLSKLVEAENKHDWETFCNLFTKDQVEHKIEYFKSDNENGVKRVESAQLKEIQYIGLNSDTSESNSILRKYIIGVQYSVNKEDKYYINGVNYHLISLQLEGDNWRVLDYQDAPLENFASQGKQALDNNAKAADIVTNLPGLNAWNVKIMLDIIDARASGIIINTNGDYLGSNKASDQNEKRSNKLLAQTSAVAVTASRTRPTAIEIDRREEDWGQEGWDFLPYCKRVLPNEWGGSWPSESLKAGAMVVMQFGAYAVLHPRHSDIACDVCDGGICCQVFRQDSSQTTCDNAVESIKGYYYQTSGGTFFETCYAAGTYSSAYANSGRMRQQGSKYWADHNKTWTWMMTYYYSNSNYSIPITNIVKKTW